MKASSEKKKSYHHDLFISIFVVVEVTQFLVGLWKGILCKEKGSRCPGFQRRTARGFLSRGNL